jgi:hypothetical protein
VTHTSVPTPTTPAAPSRVPSVTGTSRPPTTVRSVTAVASSALAPLLRGPEREVRVLAAFRAAVYLAHDDGVLALVAADGIAHPNAVVLTDPVAAQPLAGIRAHQRGTVGGGALRLGDRRTEVTRWTDPVPRLAATDTHHLAATTRHARDHLVAATGPAPSELAVPLRAVASAVLTGDDDAAVAAARRLIGAGPGLTPAGDDVLAGLLTATLALTRALHGRADHPVAATTRRVGTTIAARALDATTAVSAALLHHAARGEVATPAATVLHALVGRGALVPALDALLAVGSTSGRDLTLGLLAGADLAITTALPTPSRPAPARGGATPLHLAVAPRGLDTTPDPAHLTTPPDLRNP